jgi:hypothetical protein
MRLERYTDNHCESVVPPTLSRKGYFELNAA